MGLSLFIERALAVRYTNHKHRRVVVCGSVKVVFVLYENQPGNPKVVPAGIGGGIGFMVKSLFLDNIVLLRTVAFGSLKRLNI